MNRQKIVISGILAAGGLALARSAYETAHISAAEYKISSDKIPENKKIKIAFLSDLHGKTYGKENSYLLGLILSKKPDLILIGGDMYTASDSDNDRKLLPFLKALRKAAPVFFAPGNHEEYLKAETGRFGKRYELIKKDLRSAGIKLLENKRTDLENNISVYGLELPKGYYRRLNKRTPDIRDMERYLKSPDKGRFNILLAHTPAFFDTYEKWGPDLVLSGHYHGGIIGMPDIKKSGARRGFISPDLKFFPKNCQGRVRKNDTDLIISAGCGSHGIDFRLFNKPEVVFIELSSKA